MVYRDKDTKRDLKCPCAFDDVTIFDHVKPKTFEEYMGSRVEVSEVWRDPIDGLLMNTLVAVFSYI